MSSDSGQPDSDRIIIKNIEKQTKVMAVIRAFIANVGIASIKFVCAIVSGSSAMFSEAVHSSIDTFNSICLMVGIKRGSRPADNEHPYGYGLETNVWTLFAAIFMLGGTFTAITGGIQKLIKDSPDSIISNFNYIALTLILSIFFEAWAVHSATDAVLTECGVKKTNIISDFLRSIKYLGKINSPTTRFVWLEDVSALSGVVVALSSLSFAWFFARSKIAIFDGIASLIIGCILFMLAIYLLKNNVNFLTGKAAEPHVEEIIKETAKNIHGITNIHELKTINMGVSGLIISMQIEVDSEIPVKDADDIADMLERKIRKKIKNIQHVTIEIFARDIEDNWEEKLAKVTDEGQKIGAIDNREAKMLSNFSSFANKVVREIMVPRTDVIFVDAGNTLNEIADAIIESGHTRLPVYQDNFDNIIGIINAKDILKFYKNGENFNLKKCIRPISIVPENKFISDLLNDLISSKNQVAAVVDEHGGIAGIATIEDILEEIVGEIYDEFDEVDNDEFIKINENTINLDAKYEIEKLNQNYDLDIPTDDFDTIGGYVFGLLGREPEIGDIVEDRNISYNVLEIDGIRISRVEMTKDTPFVEVEKNVETISTENTESKNEEV